MITRKASFRLLVITICFATAVWLLAVCGDDANSSTKKETEPWVNPCIKEIHMATDDVMAKRPTHEHIEAVINQHKDLLFWYPHFSGIDAGDYMKSDLPRNRAIGYGISVRVSRLTDQSTLPEEKRIPDCLDGVPVRIIQQLPARPESD